MLTKQRLGGKIIGGPKSVNDSSDPFFGNDSYFHVGGVTSSFISNVSTTDEHVRRQVRTQTSPVRTGTPLGTKQPPSVGSPYGMSEMSPFGDSSATLGPMMEENLLELLTSLGALHSPEHQVLTQPYLRTWLHVRTWQYL